MLIDQLKEIYIDGELEAIATTEDHAPGVHGRPQSADQRPRSRPDPRPVLRLRLEHQLGWLLQQRSQPADRAAIDGRRTGRGKQILLQIEQKLAEEDIRPIIFYADRGYCLRPWVKNEMVNSNSIFDGARREDVWLDK
jgi:hypothetical protein